MEDGRSLIAAEMIHIYTDVTSSNNFLFLPPKGFPGGSVVKNSACQRRRLGFEPWVGKIPWRRKRQSTPTYILAWEIPRTEEPGAPRSWGCKRVRQDLLTKQQQLAPPKPKIGPRSSLLEPRRGTGQPLGAVLVSDTFAPSLCSRGCYQTACVFPQFIPLFPISAN